MNELKRALREMDQTSDPIERHFALQTVVTEAYRLRADDPKMRQLCRRVGTQHLSEFPTIAVALKHKWGSIPLVRTFRCLATLLAEDANFDEAVRVCESAIAHGVRDETTSGFEGRIQRIRAQQLTHATSGKLPTLKPRRHQEKPEDVRAASSTVPRFKEYFPATDKMGAAQRRYYDEWKRAWESGIVIPVDGNISYLFCYVYRLFHRGTVTPLHADGTRWGIPTIHDRAIPTLMKELEKLSQAYAEMEPQFASYCRGLLSGCHVLQGNLKKALELHPHSDLKGRRATACDHVLSLKLAMRRQPIGRDMLALQAPQISKWAREHLDCVQKHCDTILERLHGESGANILEEWAKGAHSYPFSVFNGTSFRRDTDITAYQFSDHKPVRAFVRRIVHDAENAARGELGLPPVRERRHRA